jgi:hypothetical protein
LQVALSSPRMSSACRSRSLLSSFLRWAIRKHRNIPLLPILCDWFQSQPSHNMSATDKRTAKKKISTDLVSYCIFAASSIQNVAAFYKRATPPPSTSAHALHYLAYDSAILNKEAMGSPRTLNQKITIISANSPSLCPCSDCPETTRSARPFPADNPPTPSSAKRSQCRQP